MCDRFNKILPLLKKNDPIINSMNLLSIPLEDRIVGQLIEAINLNSFISKIILDSNSLSTNSVNKIFDLLTTNPKLTHLEITKNQVNDEAIEHLRDVLLNLSPNREPIMLILRDNTFTERGARALADALQKNVPVFWLDLRYNPSITDTGVNYIANSLANNHVLIGLDLIKCGCNTLGAAALSEALMENKALTTLLLQDDFGEEAIYSLASLLAEPSCHLQALYLWRCKLVPKLLDILCNALKTNHGLTTLALSYNKLNDDSAVSISNMILKNKTLTKLHLGANSFSSTFASYVSVALSKNTTLQFLDLSRNTLTSQGIWPLTVALIDNHDLKSIDLRYNRIDQTGAEMLSELIAKNDSLKSIRLSGNSFGNASISILASKLKVNQTIKDLELNDVQMSTPGFIAICESLKENKTLEKISLSISDLTPEAMMAFAELMKVTNTLRSISMSQCNIDDEGCEYIAEGLSCNSSLTHIDLSKNQIQIGGMDKIVDALLNNFSLLQIDCQENQIDSSKDPGSQVTIEKITDYLERNNYYQHNVLMKDLASLVNDDFLL